MDLWIWIKYLLHSNFQVLQYMFLKNGMAYVCTSLWVVEMGQGRCCSLSPAPEKYLLPSLPELPVATSPVLTLSEISTRIHRLPFYMSFEFLIIRSVFFANLFCLHFDTGWLTLSYLKSVFCHDHLLHYFLLLHKYERDKITPKIMLNAKGEIALRLFHRTHSIKVEI